MLKTINLKSENLPDDKITDIKDLNSSQKNEITFLHSKKYTDLAKKTKASVCLTTKNLKKYLPKNCLVIIVKNVLFLFLAAFVFKFFQVLFLFVSFDYQLIPLPFFGRLLSDLLIFLLFELVHYLCFLIH